MENPDKYFFKVMLNLVSMYSEKKFILHYAVAFASANRCAVDDKKNKVLQIELAFSFTLLKIVNYCKSTCICETERQATFCKVVHSIYKCNMQLVFLQFEKYQVFTKV